MSESKENKLQREVAHRTTEIVFGNPMVMKAEVSNTSEELKLIDVSEKNLARMVGWSTVVDSKATFVLTLILVLLGYFVSQLVTYFEAHLKLWNSSSAAPTLLVLLDIALIATLGCLITSIVYLMKIVRPKLIPPTQKLSLFFFQTVEKMPADDFHNRVLKLSVKDALADLNDQTYNVAKVVSQRFGQLNTSITWFWYGFIAFMLFSVLRPLFLLILEQTKS